MQVKHKCLLALIIFSALQFSSSIAFAAIPDSVVVNYNKANNAWVARFFKHPTLSYKTIEIDSTSIGALNTFLLEAGEDAKIDILSPMTFTVSLEDPYQGIAPLSGQTIDFHYHTIEIINPQQLRMNGIYGVRKHNVTIQNFRLKGFLTYGIWMLGCDNLTLTNLDIDLDRGNGLAVFIRPRGTYRPHNLTINGNVYINGGYGHAIEFTSVDNVNIGDVTVTNNIGGCGINASGSTHIKIGNVYGYKNCYSLEGDGGGYASLRYSNAGEYLECKGIYSRRCGRGYMITQGDNSALPGVLGQHFSTVDVVDIKHTVKENIFIRGILPTNNHVLSGTIAESLYQPNKLIYIEGETNSVTLGLPENSIDTTSIKTVRINELQFGFYDLSSNETSEDFIRDRNCDGFGYAKTLDQHDAFMEWNVKSGNGNHTFKWRYASNITKKAKLVINGKSIGNIEFQSTEADTIWKEKTLSVRGIKATEIKNIQLIANEEKGLPMIDYLEVQAPGVVASLKDATTATDSTNVRFNLLGSKQLQTQNNIRVYPNPSNERLTIEIFQASNIPYQVNVYNFGGTLVQHTETSENKSELNMLHQPSGIYFVQVALPQQVKTFKVNLR